MQFWEKVEAATSPLTAELRERLATVPTLALLNFYQMKHHLSQFKKDEFPDGFWAKWRYLWALKLSGPFVGVASALCDETHFGHIDELVEKIFDLYTFGAVFEPGRTLGSEKEFLSRLGLGLRVREPDALCFPEQARNWALLRLKPFDNCYFLPVLGLRIEGIYEWIEKVIVQLEVRLNRWVSDMVLIAKDLNPISNDFAAGILSAPEFRKQADRLKIHERLKKNASDSDDLHIFSEAEIQHGISKASLDVLLKLFGVKPGEVEPGFVFPHNENPLDWKTFVLLPNGNLYFLDPATAHRTLARKFEQILLNDTKLRERYLKSRSRATESLVAGNARKVFPKALIQTNYYLENGNLEKDILIHHERTVILIECKNTRVREFKGANDDLIKFESDFENSVQYGYAQAHEVKRRILENDETTFLDANGNSKFSVKRSEVDRIFIVCVTVLPRGPFGTDLSYELAKENCEPFPLAIGLFDFETICKYFTSDQFIGYLRARENLHGKSATGDELNYAGYFLKFGHLNLEEKTFLADDFSGIFDRKWSREHGLDIEEPAGEPAFASMVRKGNRVSIEYNSGKKERIRLPDWTIQRTVGKAPVRMKGSDRNRRCPCGSGLKLKHCCGVS